MSLKIQAVSQSCLLLGYLTVSYSFKSKRCHRPYRPDYNACFLCWCFCKLCYIARRWRSHGNMELLIKIKHVKQEINKC